MAGPAVPPERTPTPTAVPAGTEPVPPTRTARMWLTLAGAMVVLVVVIVFILQNLQTVRVTFFATHWSIPLGIDLLLAAVLGGLVVFTAGSLRIYQLRRLAKRHASASARSAQPGQPAAPRPGR